VYDVFQETPNLGSMTMMTRAGHEAFHLDIYHFAYHSGLWEPQLSDNAVVEGLFSLAAKPVNAVNITLLTMRLHPLQANESGSAF
jgi:hypothetical protein